ncbi:hypothetical protein UFOVP237_54 [uncultured Caudovirales phage]|uniref:Uncharacterized protein n=1 Tax=uncultured Caudovirales phage TaxID=2100421 RepID=A0A6J7WY88_9CAUD|nr:hypothetical protein UFOVP237_54 [uncultured Caudovirales phage]
MKRYADPVTFDHIIELRRKLAEAERQRDNALDMLMLLRREQERMNRALEAVRKENQRQKEHIMLLYSLVQTEDNIVRVVDLKEGE